MSVAGTFSRRVGVPGFGVTILGGPALLQSHLLREDGSEVGRWFALSQGSHPPAFPAAGPGAEALLGLLPASPQRSCWARGTVAHRTFLEALGQVLKLL